MVAPDNHVAFPQELRYRQSVRVPPRRQYHLMPFASEAFCYGSTVSDLFPCASVIPDSHSFTHMNWHATFFAATASPSVLPTNKIFPKGKPSFHAAIFNCSVLSRLSSLVTTKSNVKLKDFMISCTKVFPCIVTRALGLSVNFM